MTAFEEMGVMPELGKAVEELGWCLPTDVQAEAIPLILGGGDVLMAAETGSGKTGAFCLPILQIVHEALLDIAEGRTANKSTPASCKWVLSFLDRTPAMAITPDGLRCQSREFKEWHGCRAAKGVRGRGKYYYEATVTDEGLCRVGWSTSDAALDLGTDKFGFGFGGTGKKSNNRQFDDYGEAFGKSDVVGCYLNLDTMEIRFSKNEKDLGIAFRIPQNLSRATFFPAVVLKNAEMLFNFGDTEFKYPPKDGFVAVSKATDEDSVDNQVGTGATSGSTKKLNNAPQAVVIEPSRELADQTYQQLRSFSKFLSKKISVLLVVGGIGIGEQVSALNAGVDIVVGTPGRLEELISAGHLSLTQCRFFVLDEADGLLKDNTQLINRLYNQMPKMTGDGRRLQMIVCSATLHDMAVKNLAGRLMHFPTWVDLKGEDVVPETVHHVVVLIDPQKDRSWETLKKHIETDSVHARDFKPGVTSPETLSEAVKILKGEYCVRAINKHKMDRCLIFCRTKLDCDNLYNYLHRLNYSCVCLHSGLKPNDRKKNLDRFKAGEVSFLICTDVAARGIDVSGLPFTINITLPDEKSNYVHRVGRVGRADRMGLAISLVSTVPEKVWYHGQWCSSRGNNCNNTNLTDVKGCCVWYNEPRYLAEIEDQLNVTIEQVGKDIDVPVNEFDGKVVYGEKRKQQGSGYADHVAQMAPTVQQLASLESQAQLIYLRRHFLHSSLSP